MYKVAIIVLVLALAGCSMFGGGGQSGDGLGKNSENDKPVPLVEKSISWLPAVVAVSVVLLGVSVALLVAGNKLGIAGLAGAGTVLVVAITVARFLWLIAAMGGLVALCFAGLLVWKIWENRKALDVAALGLGELVETVEAAKDQLTQKGKELIFGADDDDHGKAGDIQSPNTETIVAEIRKNGG